MEKKDIIERIQKLKNDREAVILAHNYQIGDVQDAADFVGDSLELSQKAARTDARMIIFCGVHFMAETAAILSPDKKVLIPDIKAGCPMADMITASELREWKRTYSNEKVVCYVNTTAEVKAGCDVCCTSSNALGVVESVESGEILFAPDKNLAAYIGRFSKKKIIPWDGYCYVHNNIHIHHLKEKKQMYPDAEVWVHPECRPEVIDLADRVLSTGKMVKEARATEKQEIIIGTESGIIYRLKKENPGKKFYPVKDNAFCFNMKKITLKKVLNALEQGIFEVKVPPEISQRARGAIDRMIRI